MYLPARRFTLGLLAATSALSVAAATFEVDTMPPAGLYRVETDSQMTLPGAGVRTQTDSGTSVTDQAVVNGVSHQQSYSKPQTTQCIGTQAEQMAILAKMGASCPAHTERHGAAGLVLNVQCNGMSTQTTVKRTSETTWTYDIVTSNTGAGASPGSPQSIMAQKIASIERMRQLAQASGKSTADMPTDAQIEQMKQQAQATAAKMQQQLDQMPPEQRAAMQAAYGHAATGNSPPMHLQQRYTRIGDTCTAG